MQIFDTLSLGPPAEIADTRPLRSGALVVQARAARAGNIQLYQGAELERPDRGTIRVYRDPEEIFRTESLASFGHKPVTLGHPPEAVTPRTWRGVARGHVGGEVLRDGEFVRIPLLLADAEAIAAVQAGRREISVGYTCDLDWTPGTAPDGAPYDARQTRVIVDHVAIVEHGRAGPACRIGDEADLRRQLADAVARALQTEAETTRLTAALAEREREIAALRQPGALDGLAAARTDLVAAARRLLGDAFDPTGLDAAAIRRAAVSRALGEAASRMGEAEIEGAFRALAAAPAPDPLRTALGRPAADTLTPEAAHAAMVENLRTAWRHQGAR
ncbi:DUF2213 domain-containing protein [Methylobacterium nodulans]|uniref:DUF2213 domain-containing protein n=1 Tax=Methylobacterium nodulans (strain LMG 21967 / CNCM I-2342 / ORS 2060) TaxID=460265 RepID=B8IDG3_METNO|nr:DUF2213 domain-containing protein [Methylobacterium nodulans]ACL61329.1 conserved hypothetical protein [Methylobacterium nodulans ORS 2060]